MNKFPGWDHEKIRREKPVAIRSDLAKNRRTERLAREDPWPDAQAYQVKEAVPDIVEEWKWMGTPVWESEGIITTGETYKQVVKLTFAKGASLKDPAKLFNSSLDGNARRAIDIHEGEEIDESAFKALIRQAVALNKSKPSKKTK